MSIVKEINADEFDREVKQSSSKVLVDFYAPWCGPCKMISPIVDQIAKENPELKVVKVNADNNQALMSQFGIRGIPTLLLLNEGEVVASQVGAASLAQVNSFISQ